MPIPNQPAVQPVPESENEPDRIEIDDVGEVEH
jgi:hypothetical protein